MRPVSSVKTRNPGSMRLSMSRSSMPSGAPKEQDRAMRGWNVLTAQTRISWVESASRAPESISRSRSPRGFRAEPALRDMVRGDSIPESRKINPKSPPLESRFGDPAASGGGPGRLRRGAGGLGEGKTLKAPQSRAVVEVPVARTGLRLVEARLLEFMPGQGEPGQKLVGLRQTFGILKPPEAFERPIEVPLGGVPSPDRELRASQVERVGGDAPRVPTGFVRGGGLGEELERAPWVATLEQVQREIVLERRGEGCARSRECERLLGQPDRQRGLLLRGGAAGQSSEGPGLGLPLPQALIDFECPLVRGRPTRRVSRTAQRLSPVAECRAFCAAFVER